jgi:saccharopine dehydrogenase-like NADP-dependent oxidoreductase
MFARVAVLGLGKVGRLAAKLLADSGFDVAGFDAHAIADASFPIHAADLGDARAMRAALAGHEAVLSCLPYSFNKAVASAAHALGLHYLDVTEDVATTKHIRALAESANGIMAPQCGLALGFIGIIGADLAARFEHVRSIRLRVGVLPPASDGPARLRLQLVAGGRRQRISQ